MKVPIDPKQIEAASNLEELVPELKQLILDLRDGQSQAYARVYGFRRKVSRIVAKLGAGNPGPVK